MVILLSAGLPWSCSFTRDTFPFLSSVRIPPCLPSFLRVDCIFPCVVAVCGLHLAQFWALSRLVASVSPSVCQHHEQKACTGAGQGLDLLIVLRVCFFGLASQSGHAAKTYRIKLVARNKNKNLYINLLSLPQQSAPD